MTLAVLPLREPGPAQSDLIYHFCGRPPGTGRSTHLDPTIAAMSAPDRLANILWEGMLRGSTPFGAANRMVCFSESPIEHLLWLLHDRAFPPWALLVRRQWVYDFGGGPVWYTRDAQYRTLTPEQRDWAMRFEAYNSDWLHEREWRIPVPPGLGGLPVTAETIVSVVIGEPGWAPWRYVLEPTGRWIGVPGRVAPEMRWQLRLPPLWNKIHAYWFDRANRRLVLVRVPAPG
jgi:hypothetical protein